jgi:hypothetical protein
LARVFCKKVNLSTKINNRNLLSKLRTWWAVSHSTVLRLSIGITGIISILRWRYELHRLLFESGPTGAIDLRLRFLEVNYWFAGRNVYEELGTAATYPPASYVILWPFLGWLNLTPARWFWAFTTMGSLAWLIIIAVRESLSEMLLERIFLIFLILSMYSTCVTIGNGQLAIHILPMLLGGILMIRKGQKSWLMDIFTSIMVTFCLVKPSITIPFFWILLCKREDLRPAMLTVVLYICITFFAISFQETGFFVLIKEWLIVSKLASLNATYGYANLHQWMSSMGLGGWIPHASLSVLVLLGWWIYYNRNKDIWLLLGVTAIVSRIWTYHAIYDDILILIPMIALFRIVKQGPCREGEDVVAGILLAISWFSVLSPARLLTFPSPWDLLFITEQTIVWFAMLIFLVKRINWIPQRS